MTSEEIMARGQQVLVRNYAQRPVVPVRGEGAWLWDAEGRRYLDLIGGIAVSSLGHCHPALVEALRRQAGQVLHVSNMFWIGPQVELADRLVRATFADRVLFCNSGAEANEGAVKIARRLAWRAGQPERVEIVSADSSFHGRTLAMLAATGTPKYREGFGPMPEGFRQVPYGDVAALRAAVGPRTAAVLLEPLQGEGGVKLAPPGYLAAAREICDGAGALLILDEVQTGAGRTGHLFAYQAEGVTPDVLTAAKGLGGGVPIGAVLCNEKAAGALEPGTHGTTFGGNYLACAAGLAVLDVLEAPGFLEGVRAMAERLRAELEARVMTKPWARALRARGMLLGIELAEGRNAKDITAALIPRGVLCGMATERVLRLAPPLTIGAAEIEACVAALEEIEA